MDLSLGRDGHVAVLTITRPPHNFFDSTLLRDIAQNAEELTQDAGDCRAIVLASEGKNFCAGADFSSNSADGDRSVSARETYTQAMRIFDIPVPVIACVQGAAVGGGMGLACAADLRVTSARTRFHSNFTQLGFHPGFALSRRLQDLVGTHQARRILLSSRPVRGEDAQRIGLSDEYVDTDEDLLPRSIEIAHHYASLAPLAVRSVKATLLADFRNTLSATLEHELTEQSRLWATEDSREGIAASLRRAVPVFSGR